MELEGKLWKDGKFWLIEVPCLDIMTQGKTRKEALFMIEDAIIQFIELFFEEESKVFSLKVTDYKNVIGISSNNNKLLMALSLKKQREKSGLTIREVSENLGTKYPNYYAQYEKGKTRISLDQYEKLLFAANPTQHRILRVV